MKNLMYFLAGILFVVLLSAAGNPPSLFTVKPAKPKATVVLRGYTQSLTWGDWVKKGYQISHISEGSSGRTTYVLVKY